MKSWGKNLLFIILIVVCLIMSGCSWGLKIDTAAGAGSSGDQAATNMLAGERAGDYGTATKSANPSTNPKNSPRDSNSNRGARDNY